MARPVRAAMSVASVSAEFHGTGAEIVKHSYQVAETAARRSSFHTISVSPARSVFQ
jgi:hypothetical protein